jgi:phosphoribosyl 1,2-cyclic phosphodiesterase
MLHGMRVRFWGTRGSIATPGPSTVRYGGNTSCVEVRSSRGTLIVLDCGTGARALGLQLIADAGGGAVGGSLLLGHTHWDHIQGLPFFAPLFRACHWDVFGPRGMNESLHQTLAGQMRYPYFPVALDQAGAGLDYHELVEGTFEIDDVVIRAQYLNHPALTLGYRLECDGAAVCYIADHEPFDPGLAAGGDLLANRSESRHVEFLSDADVVIHDAQYAAAEYSDRIGWGHSTVEYAVDVCRAAGASTTVLFHHEPTHDDDTVDGLLAMARRRAGGTTDVVAAAEGAALEVSSRAARSSGVPSTATATTQPALARPALEDLDALTVVVTDDERLQAVVTQAATSEQLPVVDPSELGTVEDTRRVLVVADVDVGGHVLDAVLLAVPPAVTGGQTMIAVTRHPGGHHAMPQLITDWIVWPASEAHVRTKLRAALLRRAARWLAAPQPDDEAPRLAALRALGLLDTAPEARFDAFTTRACERFNVPMSTITLVDSERQWFKSRIGIEFIETPRDLSFCAHTILGPHVMQVPDTALDPRFADSPVVTSGPRVRFYAGAPLTVDAGYRIGTLCIADQRPRLFGAAELDELQQLADRLVEALQSSGG